jgi:hypothetical protein
VNATSGNGATPLHWAAGSGHVTTCQLLLNHGASPSMRTFTWNRTMFGKGKCFPQQ